MTVSIYLERYALDIIQVYGDVDEVINRMLDSANGDEFDVFDKPSIGPRIDSVRYNVNVTNEDYIQLLTTMPVNSPRISLRRFVHWFIDNEMPEQLGWKPVGKYKQKEHDRINKILNNIESEVKSLDKLYDMVGCENHTAFLHKILQQIKYLREA